jgi:NADH-quinone oxidoreductase subunit H
MFPFGFLAFFIFAVAMVAETNRAPFDLPEAESELVAGFHTEYSGFRWSLFFLAEYAAMLAVSSIAVTLWIGGWMRPFPHWLAGDTWDTFFSFFPAATFFLLAVLSLTGTVRMPKHPAFKIQKAGLGAFTLVLGGIGVLLLIPPVKDRIQDIYWFIAKVSLFMYAYIWYRGTFPRYRFDQLMKLGWKVMIPVGIAVLIVVAAAPAFNFVW